MKIKQITANKKQYLDLLLLADESEDMIDLYLEEADMFVLENPHVVASCVVSKHSSTIFEIKNLATSPSEQRKGYGRQLVQYIFNHYKCKGAYTIIVGTGESPLTLPFYQSCGFVIYDRIENFFTIHYPNPIIEEGIILKDMILLKKEL